MLGDLKLYQFQGSGNCYKVRLALHQLGRSFSTVEVDVAGGETRTPAFLKLNPAGKVPLLDLGGGRRLSESNAILLHFAEGTALLPTDRFERAKAYQWLFWEQYSHEPCIAVARSLMHFLGKSAEDEPRLPGLWEKGRAALELMQNVLSTRAFFAGGRYSMADIALYAYTHVAHEGGFDLEPYPAIRAWMERVAAQPLHIPIDYVIR
jgi:glutathione S-transferase